MVSVAQFEQCQVESVIENLIKLFTAVVETKGNLFKVSCRLVLGRFRITTGRELKVFSVQVISVGFRLRKIFCNSLTDSKCAEQFGVLKSSQQMG